MGPRCGLYTMFFLFGVLPYKTRLYVLQISMASVISGSPGGNRVKPLPESTQTREVKYEFIRTMRDEVLSTTDAYLFAGLMNVSISEIIRKGDDIMPINEDTLRMLAFETKRLLDAETKRIAENLQSETTIDNNSYQSALNITNGTIEECIALCKSHNIDVPEYDYEQFFRDIDDLRNGSDDSPSTTRPIRAQKTPNQPIRARDDASTAPSVTQTTRVRSPTPLLKQMTHEPVPNTIYNIIYERAVQSLLLTSLKGNLQILTPAYHSRLTTAMAVINNQRSSDTKLEQWLGDAVGRLHLAKYVKHFLNSPSSNYMTAHETRTLAKIRRGVLRGIRRFTPKTDNA
jgi:hypothetical protein